MRPDISPPEDQDPLPPPGSPRKGNWHLVGFPSATVAIATIVKQFFDFLTIHSWYVPTRVVIAANVIAPAAFLLILLGPRLRDLTSWLGRAVSSAVRAVLSPVRSISNAVLGAWVRSRYGHLFPDQARAEFRDYSELFNHFALLEVNPAELCAIARIRPIVARYFLAHREQLPRGELLEAFCDAALLPVSYLKGDKRYGDELTIQRLLHYSRRRLATGWTLHDVITMDEEGRAELLAAVEGERRHELKLLDLERPPR